MQYDLLEKPSGYRPPEDIRVLVGCEKSGIGRNAFLKLGFDAYSCDLKPAVDRSNRHLQCDIRDLLDDGTWDVLCVLHPPCTALCNSGNQWHTTKLPKGKTRAQQDKELKDGCELFSDCWNCSIPHVAVENPVMWWKPKQMIRNFQPHSQSIQPYMFGEPFKKKTLWWLRRLPKLKPTNILQLPEKGSEEDKKWQMIHRMPPSEERSDLRSKTFQGHANAFASQWGKYVCENSVRVA